MRAALDAVHLDASRGIIPRARAERQPGRPIDLVEVDGSLADIGRKLSP